MKNMITLALLLLVFFTNSSCAQTIIPLEEAGALLSTIDNMDADEELTIPPGPIYYKDVNHYLDKYVGTWEGTFNNKTFQLRIVKILYEDPDPDPVAIKVDELRAKYTITDNNTGAVLADTMDLPDDSDRVLTGKNLTPGGRSYAFIYSGFDYRCGQEGDLLISAHELAPASMRLVVYLSNDMGSLLDCPTTAPNIFPTRPTDEWMTLTKQ